MLGKKISKVFMVLIVSLTSISINAASINTEKCKDSLEQIFTIVNQEVIDSRTVEGREKHLDALFNLMKNEYSGKNKQDSRFADCFAVPLENDVAIKLIRMLYGENVNQPIGIYASIWGFIWDRDVTVNYDKLDEDTDFLNFIPDLIISFNKIVFSVVVFLVAIIYGKTIFKFLIERDPRKLKNNAKNIGKIVLGLTLVAPMELLGEYSLIQFAFLMLIIFAILIAKVLWLLIVLSMNFSYMEKDVTELIIEEGVISDYIQPILDNAMIHSCDIEMREKFLNEVSYEFENNIALLKQNDYYTCLTSGLTSLASEALYSETSFIPKQIMIGQYCAIKYQKIKLGDPYCGAILRPKWINYKHEDIKELKNKAYSALGIEEDSYQDIMREIGYQTLVLSCNKNGNNVIDTKNNKFECAKLDYKTGNYLYEESTNLIKFNNIKVSEPEKIDSDYNDYSNIYKNKIKEHFNLRMPELAKVVADSKFRQKSVNEEIESFISLYEKGFAMAGTIFYERVNLLLVDREAVRAFKNVYKVNKPSGYFYKVVDGVIAAGGNIAPQETEKSLLLSITMKTLRAFPSLMDYAGDLVEAYVDAKHEDSLLKTWSEISKTQSTCMSDYQTCKLVAINPFLDLMDSGQEMMFEGILWQLGIKAVNKIFSFITSDDNGLVGLVSQLLEFIGQLFFLYSLVGFFFAILLPFIPFFIYAGLIFGWIVQTLKILLTSQLLSIYFVIPNDKEDFAGQEVKIYKLIIKTALQPLLLLTGFLVCIMLANISITLINVWLSSIQGTIGLDENATSIMSVLHNIIGIVMYAVFVTLAVIKSTEAIAAVPKSMSSWLDIEIEEDKAFTQVRQIIENYVFPHIKMSSII